ncbi:single-stranded-DNA-specific exonuclease RecJ [Allocoleopsis sp.]|uniref:single-stranded-DNA-specific exonuclease RecJ n=1 Tax=Allocoleopsis sp. TaxID=3088169 RepID=UPI002FCF9046
MSEPQLQWQVSPPTEIPQWFLDAIKPHILTKALAASQGRHAAQLLWKRGIRDAEQLPGFLNPDCYQPASPFEFGQEMQWAVERLQQACKTGEMVAIWGDFDADGITSTAVLWEGLGQFLPQEWQLIYYIPNRLTESHGLNCQGIDALQKQGCQLIVTCDTGSTNLKEIDYAQTLGIDVIVTDHHTLPSERPPVKAIINPRYLPPEHPLFHLSGVAVAYKLVEGLYQTLPDVPQQPLESLLDLVAIGLIADLVQLSGDCRYLAQRGIERLQQQLKIRTRPGVARLLELCQRNGDRPTDISFGLGPRINAVSRIQGDASFCVELLTSTDEKRCEQLAIETELANTRRKSLQKDVTQQVKAKLEQLDLSTTSVIVLEDSQWPAGVLGLVAGQVAQEYGRPTILLSTEGASDYTLEKDEQDAEVIESKSQPNNPKSKIQNPKLARGSARSVNNIDLYQLVKSQEHLLHRFGGHPFAAGLSLPVENLPLFTEAINQQLRQQVSTSGASLTPVLEADIIVTIAELGKELFYELKLLEPCGMGNPVPKLLIQNCWFEEVRNYNTQDFKGRKVQFIKTEFEIWDDSCHIGFPGIWWGHYRDEVPKGRCDAIVELDYNNYKKRPEVRLLAVRSCVDMSSFNIPTQLNWILDWRGEELQVEKLKVDSWEDNIQPSNLQPSNLQPPTFNLQPSTSNLQPSNLQPSNLQPLNPLTVSECPTSWDELQVWLRRAIASERKLALAYPPPSQLSPSDIWKQLVGIAKFLSRTGQTATLAQLQDKLDLSDRILHLGLNSISHIGFNVKHVDWAIAISGQASLEVTDSAANEAIQNFLAAVEEEQFLRQYFYQVPLSTIQSQAWQINLNERLLT